MKTKFLKPLQVISFLLVLITFSCNESNPNQENFSDLSKVNSITFPKLKIKAINEMIAEYRKNQFSILNSDPNISNESSWINLKKLESFISYVKAIAKDNNLNDKKYHIITYGCQMNKNDSERMCGMLENIGYSETEVWQDANLVILNTCSIRDRAERRVVGKFQVLHHHRQKHNKDMQLAITGCMPQHMKDFVQEKIPYIDYVVGVNNMEILPSLIGENKSISDQVKLMRPNRRQEKDVISFEKNLVSQKRQEGDKAWVSIMFGCDKFCTYCIVPFTRGREMSRKKEDIFSEIEALEGKGYEQIVLLGQNVNSYGLTSYEDYDFADLMEEVVIKFPWIKKLDFITSHPKDVNEKLIDVIAKYPTISREIHFPSQHGDNKMLEAMNRGYTIEEYNRKVALIREKVEGAMIGTDLIVGFPGETEEQFQALLNHCKEIKYDYANTAAYSVRPGTKAERMPGHLEEQVKKERLQMLNRTLEEIYRSEGIMRPKLG